MRANSSTKRPRKLFSSRVELMLERNSHFLTLRLGASFGCIGLFQSCTISSKIEHCRLICLAPEVLNYEPISLATDMWSVGVLLYVLLTGCSPFGGDTKQETFCNISRCRLDFPDDLFEDVSEEARDLMRKLMVKDPE